MRCKTIGADPGTHVPPPARLELQRMSGQVLLARLTARTLTTSSRLEFHPYDVQVEKESVGMINLAIINGRLCFLLGRRTAQASDLRGLYALPTGKTDGPTPTPADLSDLENLKTRGLIKPEELSPIGETVFAAAKRENREEAGRMISTNDVLGRIEFQGAKETVRVVAFLANAEGKESQETTGELDNFQWVPIEIILDAAPGDEGEAVQQYLRQEDPQANLMKGLLLRGMAELRRWLENQLYLAPFGKTWIGRMNETLSTDKIERLTALAQDDHYYTRLFATARILAADVQLADNQDSHELSQIVAAYRKLESQGYFERFARAIARPNTPCDPAWVLSLEEDLAKLLQLPFLTGQKGPSWEVREWVDRSFLGDFPAEVTLQVSRGASQPARAIILWQFAYDLYQLRDKISSWRASPLAAITFLIGRTLAQWSTTSYAETVAEIAPCLQSISASPEISMTEETEVKTLLEMLPALAKTLNQNCPTLKAAVILTRDGQIVIGHNGVPSWDDYMGCGELMSGCIRSNGLSRRTDFRRSICAEQRGMLWALEAGLDLEGATLFLTGPCNQCGEMFAQLGGKVLYTTRGYKDPLTDQLFSVLDAQIISSSDRSFQKIVL